MDASVAGLPTNMIVLAGITALTLVVGLAVHRLGAYRNGRR